MIFLDIVKDKIVEIPLIQRDYVLGKDEKRAKSFLKAIKKAINDSGLNLDFVYGNSEKNKNKFIPIDGQQRLTTLFLIYYYLSLENNHIENLTKFSYAVRPSSKDFIKALTSEYNWNNLKQTNIKNNIKNSSWYFLSWENDLTVQSIVNMLGFIEDIFKGEDISKLKKIEFQFLDLDEYSLGEDLYIKMNARGKQLTDFENFKSKFEKFILDPKIIAKLDNDWLDIFWELSGNNPKLADEYYYNFFYNATLNFYVENNSIDSSFFKKKELLDFYENVYPSKVDDIIILLNNLNNYKDLEIFCKIKIDREYNKRLYFYSWSLGVLKGLDSINQKRWKRVSNNLIDNKRIETPSEFLNALRELKKLFNTINNDVYKDINFYNIGIFTTRQIREEELKIKLILNDSNNQLWDWEEEFIKAEKYWYLNGQIGFLIKYAKDNFNDFADFNDFYEFEKYRDKFIALWDFANKDKNNQILIYRALLTFGDYLPKINNDNNKTFCSFDKSLREKDENWRRVFNDNQKSYFLKNLLDSFDKDHIRKSLKNIIKNWLNEYNCDIASKEKRYLYILISNKKHIEYSHHLHIRFYSYDEVYFLTKTRMNGLHNELYTYSFYIEYLKKSNNLPFVNIYYKEQSSWNNPCIVLENKDYDLNIEYRYKKEIGFKVIFSTNKKNKLNEQINNLLKENGFFQYKDCYNGEICFYYNSVFSLCQMEELFNVIKKITKQLENIK